jgi:hypothetical protein
VIGIQRHYGKVTNPDGSAWREIGGVRWQADLNIDAETGRDIDRFVCVTVNKLDHYVTFRSRCVLRRAAKTVKAARCFGCIVRLRIFRKREIRLFK